MSQTLHGFDQARILVVGDVMLDRYWHGATERISPEAPVPVVHVRGCEERAGGAGNVALNISALGGKATLVGLTGRDAEAGELARLLNEAGVVARLLQIDGLRTITKLRVVARHQQLIRLDFEQPEDAGGHHGAVEQACAGLLEGCSALVLSDYAKGTLERPQRLIGLAREAGVPVLVDPKGHDFGRYRGATVLTPNLKEFLAVTGPCRDEQELEHKASRMCQDLELRALLVTRGEQGMTLVEADGAVTHLPARAREVFDVTGAGDTVIAVLALGLAAGWPLPQATGLANTAAGVAVGKLGASPVLPAELEGALHQETGDDHAVVDEETLLQRVRTARLRGETVVMTNGCFDLLHPGHVRYLQQARALGDRLVVAVNDDASVARLKGDDRPINTLQDRMTVLAALASVDWVVPFGEDTPERLIGRVLPDILVKGGDYRPEEIAGGEAVRAAGGQVVVLDYIDGHSSSAIIENARRGTGEGAQ